MMAIERHEDLELNNQRDALHGNPSSATVNSPPKGISAPRLEQLRSQELPCFTCPRRSVIFLREHTYLKRNPMMITCPNCLQGVETIVERRSSNTTHLSALLLLPVCCCALPYCSKMLRDSVHRCPSCGVALGVHFASAHEAFVTCCTTAQHDRYHTEQNRCFPSEAQFF